MIELYKTYNEAKKVFVRPKVKCFFGCWRKDPCLPVWRRGPIIRIGSDEKTYYVNNSIHIKTGESVGKYSNGKEYPIAHYESVTHKLPKKLKPHQRVWKSKYRKKWWAKILPAEIRLPNWLSFHIFNHDVFWKTKWTDYDIRYEYPPQFTIVFFGLSLSFYLVPKCKNETDSDYNYWESLLAYLYGKYPGDLTQTVIEQGKWSSIAHGDYFAFSKSYIKPEFYEEYDKAVELYEELKQNESEHI